MKHKVFVSYHHAKDQLKADYIRTHYGENDTLIDRSLESAYIGLSDDMILSKIRTDHLKYSTVTIVLIGEETSNRKWVDWEINASLRPYGDRTINGLLGIYLPSAKETPKRLQDNIDSGYAVTMKWENISWQLEQKIQEAYNNRSKSYLINNSRVLKKYNT